MMRQPNLRNLLLAGMLLCIAWLLGLFLVLSWQDHRHSLQLRDAGHELVLSIVQDSLQTRGAVLADQLARSAANPLYFLDLDRISTMAEHAKAQIDVVEVLIAGADGRIVHASHSGIEQPLDRSFGAMLPALPAGAIATLADPGLGEIELYWAGQYLFVEAPILLGELPIGQVRVVLTTESGRSDVAAWSASVETGLTQARQARLRWLAAGMLVLFGLAVAGLLLLRRRVLNPIRALVAAAAAIEAGRFAEAAALPSGDDELGELNRAFRRMADAVSRHQREVRRLAYTDALTGLGNRLALGELLESRLLTLQASSGELALLFVDLDEIKRVNDTLGHQVGDEVLVLAASRIQATCVEAELDSIELARFGGDEFVVLFTGSEVRAQADALCQRLLAALQQPMQLHGRVLVIGASIGITVFPDDASSASQMLKNADMAMYQAKAAGKGCYRFYSQAMDDAIDLHVRLEHDLRGAWDRGELSLAFQPVYELDGLRVVGAEALLRWNHPELGLVLPQAFVGIAEETGLVDAIGRRVLEQAVRTAAAWPRPPGRPAPFVAVNVSAKQLLRGDLPEMVEEILAASGLAPARLHLELTETAILGDETQAIAAFARLRELGVCVWLDDFGTGFSGLSHLRRVPVDGVKIDRSFISDLQRDPNDLALTTGIIAMARSLGVTVVAEGIENEAQYLLLRERGCALGQGFHLGRPVDALGIALLLR